MRSGARVCRVRDSDGMDKTSSVFAENERKKNTKRNESNRILNALITRQNWRWVEAEMRSRRVARCTVRAETDVPGQTRLWWKRSPTFLRLHNFVNIRWSLNPYFSICQYVTAHGRSSIQMKQSKGSYAI